MGKRIAMGFLGGLLGYLLGAFGGGFLVSALSTNTHDRSVEAAMTGAFVLGPLVAVVGAVAGVWWSGRH
jgi:ABC-type antimicrobial peptide transport system permease subunit